MDIKDVRLKKGMSKEEVNELIGEWMLLEDDVYMGANHKHDWRCKCGNIFPRQWNHIRSRNSVLCTSCLDTKQYEKYQKIVNSVDGYKYIKTFKSGEELPCGDIKDKPYVQIEHTTCGSIYEVQISNFISGTRCIKCNAEKYEQRYKQEVERAGEYEYIRSFRNGDVLPNGKTVKGSPHIQIKHKYCGSIYEIQAGQFISNNIRCSNCCKKYENSFAYHIEVELGEPLEKYWDFEKNTVNPYHISNKTDMIDIWIKCHKTDYHESYRTNCYSFIRGNRCSYCRGFKVHPKDSFAQYHIDNTDKNFLEKYWDYDKNTVDPWSVNTGSSSNKVWIKCQEKYYHGSYEIKLSDFTKGNRCSYCKAKKIHPKDSFGQYLKDNNLFNLWSKKNNENPFTIAKNNNRLKIYMLCGEKEYHNENDGYITTCNKFTQGNRCNMCSGNNVHRLDSFGYHNLDKTQSWHPDNNISPFRVSNKNGKEYKFICPNCEISFDRKISNASIRGVFCKECSMSEGEKKIAEWLRYNNVKYEYEKEYEGLIGVGGGNLSYDFYLVDYNMLIEFQGDQHRHYAPGFHKTHKDFERQQEHDRRKREYAKEHDIKLLEIWEEDKDNIEEILQKQIIDSNKLI